MKKIAEIEIKEKDARNRAFQNLLAKGYAVEFNENGLIVYSKIKKEDK